MLAYSYTISNSKEDGVKFSFLDLYSNFAYTFKIKIVASLDSALFESEDHTFKN